MIGAALAASIIGSVPPPSVPWPYMVERPVQREMVIEPYVPWRGLVEHPVERREYVVPPVCADVPDDCFTDMCEEARFICQHL